MKERSATVRSARAADGLGVQVPDVHSLVDVHARILAQHVHQLVVSDVDGHHAVRAAAQQDVGKSSGGGAGVEAAQPLGLHLREGVEGSGQLVAGAAHVVGDAVVEHRQRIIRGDGSRALPRTVPAREIRPALMSLAACVRERASPRATSSWSSLATS